MYKLTLILAVLIPVMTTCRGTPTLQPAASTSQVNFVKEIAIDSPVAVAVDEDGWIYVVRENGSVEVMTGDGVSVVTLKGVSPDGQRILKQPSGLAVYDKSIFVIDRALCRVVVFSCSGKYLDSFGGNGKGDKEFSKPSDIDVYDGFIYVADFGGDRIQVFSTDGIFLQSITGQSAGGNATEAIRKPLGVVVDYRGFVSVTCAGQKGTRIFLPNGTFYKKLPDSCEHGAVDVSRDGFYVADQKRLSIKKYDHSGNLLFSFGSKETGRSRFGNISDLAVDPAGSVYVADKKRGLIHVFRPEQGKAYADWQKVPPPTSVKWIEDINVSVEETVWVDNDTFFGMDNKNKMIFKVTAGQIKEKFHMPDCKAASLALDKEGDLWVLDKSKKLVIQLDDDSRIRSCFGSSGRDEGQFAKPSSMTISSAGIVYVSDSKNRWVQAFSRDGVLLNVFRKGKGDNPFVEPVALALDQNDVLHVLDRERCTVTAISPEGQILFEFGRKGRGKGEFLHPVSLFATGAEIFVLDAESCSIKVFNADGCFIRAFGTQGNGKGDFRNPTWISPVNATAFSVADLGNQRVQVLGNVYSPMPPVDTVAEGWMHAVRLSWRKRPEPYVSLYRIYRAESEDGPFVNLGDSQTNSFVDNDVASEKIYFYRVAAEAAGGREGEMGRPVKAEAAKYVPSMLSGLKAMPHECSIDLIWDQNMEDFVTGYIISRQIEGEMIVVGKTVGTVFSESGLTPGTSYTYRVAAVGFDGKESRAATVTATTVVSKQAAFESIGINTNNTLWVPVETTLVGHSFISAWEGGRS